MNGIAMATIVLGFAFLLLLVNYFRLRHLVRRGKEALAATFADCEAGEQFFGWLAEHDEVPREHPEFQRLLRKKVEAYREFLRTHPYCQNKAQADHLIKLEDLLVE